MSDDFPETSCFAAAPDINISVIDGEAALLDVRTGAYFGLNEVGTFIWEGYAKGQSYGDVVRSICREFSVDPGVAAADAARFTRKVLDRGLLRVR